MLRNIISANYSLSELTSFISISQKISVSYLKYLEINGKHIRSRGSEGTNELNDVAIDCIADLFMRNEAGQFIQLTRYFSDVIKSDPPPAEYQLSCLLRRLIVKKTKQELSRIFKERDPESAKIIRNIKVSIRNSTKFKSFKEMGREFIYLAPLANKISTALLPQPEREQVSTKVVHDLDAQFREKLERHIIPEKVLFHYFLQKHVPSDSVSAMLEKMMEIVNSLPQYQNCIALEVAASIIREVTFQHAYEKLTENIDYHSPMAEIQFKEIHEVNQSVIASIHRKIEKQYLQKEKITQERAAIYSKAISDFVQELTQDKATDSNFQYLKRYIPSLTQELYREQERSIFEYLVKLTKKSLRKRLKELL